MESFFLNNHFFIAKDSFFICKVIITAKNDMAFILYINGTNVPEHAALI